MLEDRLLPFSFAAVGRKKITAAFDGGRMTSDGGVTLLAAVEKELGLADRLAPLITDPRNPLLVTHSVADILRARMLAIACGYEDADDLDHLRTDPGFKLACGRLPDSGTDLCSQPTVSRWENAPTLREVMRMTYAMVDTYCASYQRPPRAVTLDIDDTLDVVHGHQQLSLFNGHYDERCLLPIHVYDTATARPVAMVLRTGTAPSGIEIRGHLRRLLRRIRSHWPATRLTIRGDSHYGRPEVMAWCEANGLDYIFALAGNAVVDRLVEPIADDVRVRRAEAQAPVVRRYTEIRYSARSWRCERRVAARIEATAQGLDIRYVVTNIAGGAQWLYDVLYCARAGREPDQVAQDPACLRSHQLPFAARQPGASFTAHRRRLVDAQGPQCHSQAPATGHRRVHHLADAPDQDRCPHRRNRKPGAPRLRRRASRGGVVRQPRPLSSTRWTMTDGACAPQSPDYRQPPTPAKYPSKQQ